MTARPPPQGFTLAELLVALFIFGLIAAASVALLVTGVNGQESSARALDETAALRRMNTILNNDLSQAAARVWRDEAGVQQNAFYGGSGSDGDLVLGLVRRGWTNYEGRPRSSLQRIDYRLVAGRLERSIYPYVDGAAPQQPAVIIEGVERLSLRYLDRGEWRDRWDPTLATRLPAAVEITAEITGFGIVRQVFVAGYGA